MDEGWGVVRRPVMYNDFVLVGPRSDPAMVKAQTSIGEAFLRIAEQESQFVSRGDESGTHQKEREVWGKIGREPQGDWYIRAGAGMAQVLRIADEKQAYTLTDRGTFLALRKELELEILFDRDPLLRNDYAVMIVNTTKHPHVNAAAAEKFVDFLIDPTTMQTIADFGVEEFGEPLFFPK
jgi:tungstate transport system substrate-binding protein